MKSDRLEEAENILKLFHIWGGQRIFGFPNMPWLSNEECLLLARAFPFSPLRLIRAIFRTPKDAWAAGEISDDTLKANTSRQVWGPLLRYSRTETELK